MTVVGNWWAADDDGSPRFILLVLGGTQVWRTLLADAALVDTDRRIARLGMAHASTASYRPVANSWCSSGSSPQLLQITPPRCAGQSTLQVRRRWCGTRAHDQARLGGRRAFGRTAAAACEDDPGELSACCAAPRPTSACPAHALRGILARARADWHAIRRSGGASFPRRRGHALRPLRVHPTPVRTRRRPVERAIAHLAPILHARTRRSGPAALTTSGQCTTPGSFFH